ncbi:RICIN domain-containing protein, partial [Streptomyces sp. NPDC054933]
GGGGAPAAGRGGGARAGGPAPGAPPPPPAPAAAVPAAPAASPQHDEPPTPLRTVPKSDPRRGMVYAGLVAAPKDDRCTGEYQVAKARLCTHGPDAAPKGVDIHKLTAPAVQADAKPPVLHGGQTTAQNPSTADLLKGAPPVLDARNGSTVAASTKPSSRADTPSGTKVVCDGDGITGNRVQVLYVHAPGQDRYAQYLPSFKKWAADTDVIYNASAQETGGTRHVRFVTESDCTVSVLDVELSASTLQEFGATNDALAAQGFNRRDRKYMIFADAQVYCGIGTFNGDERPGQDNTSNFGPSYGRTDNGCWSGATAAHELGHNLGAVNNSAPDSSKGGHCTDTNDLMCYSDYPYYPQMHVVCADPVYAERLDCRHDDYFNTDPKTGSYLSTHWNVANNQFLIGANGTGPNPNPSPTPSPTSTSTSTGPDAAVSQVTQNSATVSWQAVSSAAGYEILLNGHSLGTVRSTVARVVYLRPDTDYTLAIAVRDQNGNVSKPGREAAFHTLKQGGSGDGTPQPGKPYLMFNSLTGQSADMWGGSTNDGTVLIGYQRTGYANQQWIFDDAGSGLVRIKSALSGKCLQPGGDLVEGQFVMQEPCTDSAAQQWKLTPSGGGYTLTPQGSSLALGTSDREYYGGQLLELQQPDDQGYQNWTVQPVS